MPIVEKGVSQQLAIYRKANIENVRYTLFFDIPDKKEQKVMGNERISFQWKGKDDLQIDFQGELLSLKVNGEEMKADYHDEHIVIPADAAWAKLLGQGLDSPHGVDVRAGEGAVIELPLRFLRYGPGGLVNLHIVHDHTSTYLSQ